MGLAKAVLAIEAIDCGTTIVNRGTEAADAAEDNASDDVCGTYSHPHVAVASEAAKVDICLGFNPAFKAQVFATSSPKNVLRIT
jgi:hypothetical protein